MAAPPRITGRAPTWRLLLRGGGLLLLTALALALLAWQVRRAGWAAVLGRIQAADPALVALAVLLTASRFWLFAARLAAISRRVAPRCRAAGLLPIVLVSQLLVLVIPGFRPGATLLRAQLSRRRHGGEFGGHLAANLVDQAAQAIAWVAAAALLLPVLASREGAAGTGELAAGVAGVGAAVLLGLALLHRHRRRLRAWSGTPVPTGAGRLRRAGGVTLRGAGRLAVDRAALSIGIGGGMLFVLLGGLAQAAALRAVGEPAPWWLALLAVALGTTAGTAANTPGGLGVTEAAQVAFLVAQGLPPDSAASGVLLARGLHLACIAAGGSVSLLLLWRRGPLPIDLAAGDPEAPTG